jgi:hypothetical protein
MKKVIKDGKVAVLISSGYESGWYSWNRDVEECLFSPEIIELVEKKKIKNIDDEFCQKLFKTKYFYAGGARNLEIVWLPIGTKFRVNEYDGSESIEIIDEIKYKTA